jgi:hypothetical protein
LRNANATINFRPLGPDNYGRSGEAYLIFGPEVDLLESTLQGKFEPTGASGCRRRHRDLFTHAKSSPSPAQVQDAKI